jgi:hypothetical protein
VDQILLGLYIGLIGAALKEFGPAMLDFILDFPRWFMQDLLGNYNGYEDTNNEG